GPAGTPPHSRRGHALAIDALLFLQPRCIERRLIDRRNAPQPAMLRQLDAGAEPGAAGFDPAAGGEAALLQSALIEPHGLLLSLCQRDVRTRVLSACAPVQIVEGWWP